MSDSENEPTIEQQLVWWELVRQRLYDDGLGIEIALQGDEAAHTQLDQAAELAYRLRQAANDIEADIEELRQRLFNLADDTEPYED